MNPIETSKPKLGAAKVANEETRHLYFAQTRHFNIAPAAGGLISLVMLSIMYNANRFFLAPATKARQAIERIGADGFVELLG